MNDKITAMVLLAVIASAYLLGYDLGWYGRGGDLPSQQSEVPRSRSEAMQRGWSPVVEVPTEEVDE
ncbi:hypothetical protein [Halolamina sp. C58]|uniref:hypothetical protein n=1 Tax=Halolamina sp. C58 TaxID=3421640 RepID=UPI003EC04D5B